MAKRLAGAAAAGGGAVWAMGVCVGDAVVGAILGLMVGPGGGDGKPVQLQ